MSAARAAFLLWAAAAAFASTFSAEPPSPPPATGASGNRPSAVSRRHPGQPPSGASAGISEPHFGQSLSALVIVGESLALSPLFYCVKFYQRLRPDHSN